MSFNRGKKRDSSGSYGNRSFSDRGMGGSGSIGSNVGRSNNLGGGRGIVGVNPWETGVMPGRGILPTPSNNLSLASPQAQLAIASNLLSNLLRTQQETQSQVPSLLSLGNNFSGSGPNFGSPGQQNFSHGRFNDRVMRHPMKSQRSQPYNKMGNRARDGVAGRRGPSSSSSAQHSRASGNQHMNGNQSHHRNDKSSKAITASKQNQSVKKEQQDNKASDKTNEKTELPDVKSEDSNETKGDIKKRDWQDEKMEVEGSQSAKTDDSDAKKGDSKKDDSDKKSDKIGSPTKGGSIEKDGKTSGKKSESRHAESRYADVPMSHMFCHVCNKHMWDGSSFENHLRGRAHQLMMDKLDESYKLKVDLMRHELRVAEEQRELTLNNSKRRGKKVSVDLNVRDYCTMCDLNFYGTLSNHRKSEKHQQLKTFLHPRCIPCSKEFPSRIEYDEHCLTPLHMKNAVQNEEQRKLKKKDKLAKGEAEVRTADDEEKDVGTDYKNDKQDDQKDSPDNANYFTDLTEELTNPNVKIPNYKYCRQNQISIGRSMVKEVNGYYCEKCRRFMLHEDDMISHLRTITHYRNFVQEAKVIITNAEKEAKKLEEASKSTEEESVKSQADNEEYEGNWKRRKTSGQENSYEQKAKEEEEKDDEDIDEEQAVEKEDDDEEDEAAAEDEEKDVVEDVEEKTDEEKQQCRDKKASILKKSPNKGGKNGKESKEVTKNLRKDTKKKSDKETLKKDFNQGEKYDPLETDATEESDAEGEDDERGQKETEKKENKDEGQDEDEQIEDYAATGGAATDSKLKKEEKDEAVEKMLEDMDENDSYREARNLIDDTGDDKVDIEEDTTAKAEEVSSESVESEAAAKSSRGRNFYRQRGNRARRSRR